MILSIFTSHWGHEIYNFGKPSLTHHFCILNLSTICSAVEKNIFKKKCIFTVFQMVKPYHKITLVVITINLVNLIHQLEGEHVGQGRHRSRYFCASSSKFFLTNTVCILFILFLHRERHRERHREQGYTFLILIFYFRRLPRAKNGPCSCCDGDVTNIP